MLSWCGTTPKDLPHVLVDAVDHFLLLGGIQATRNADNKVMHIHYSIMTAAVQ